MFDLFKSVRFKTTLFYSFTIFLALSLFSFFLYGKLEKALYEYIDEVLFLKAETVADNIEELAKDYSNTTVINKKGCNERLICFKKLKEELEKIINSHINDPHFNSIAIRILNSKGEVVLSSLNMPDVSFISENIENIVHGKAYYETVRLKISSEYTDYRVYSTPIKIENGGVYIVEVLRPLVQSSFTLSAVRRYIYLFIPLVVIITASLGMIMVKITLKPIDELIETMNRIIAEGDLNLRVNLPKRKDESWKVATLFNDTMSKLEKMFLLQKDFIYDSSHSLKTPLTVIKGEIDIALKRKRSCEEYIQTLKSVGEEVDRLINLVEDFITIARINNFENKYLAEIVDVRDVINDAIDSIIKFARVKNIQINKNIENSEMKTMGERGLLVKAVSNIIENAIKYSYDNSDITVSAKKEFERIVIEVNDKGIGIPEQSLKRVFDKFYRATNVKEENGFGLGLFISKSAVESCGGKIDVESVEGKGTSVRIYLRCV